MIKKLMKIVSKVLDIINKIAATLGLAAACYLKAEAKKAELDAQMTKIARYIVIGVLTGGMALILFIIIKCIVKKCKKCKEKKLKKQLEKQLALEV